MFPALDDDLMSASVAYEHHAASVTEELPTLPGLVEGLMHDASVAQFDIQWGIGHMFDLVACAEAMDTFAALMRDHRTVL
jgi:hypothetical protein